MPTAASLAHADTNNLEPFFMPFTANRSFKADPRLIVGAEGVHYIARDGRRHFRRLRRALVRECRPLP